MKTPGDVFDVPLFWRDVKDYIGRRKWSIIHTADQLDVNSSNLSSMFKFEKNPSLRYAYALAKLCDLDMNRYVK